jgi:8-oxo-dGTP pyrophosphatase MutT (NUDIX family)
MPDEAHIPEFGLREARADAPVRPGAYGIIEDNAGRVALVRTPSVVLLPGGGQDPGESLEEALVREVREETGLEVRVAEYVGTADEVTEVRGKVVRKRCAFFRAAVAGLSIGGKVEMDHELWWVPFDDAIGSLSHESQRWALRRCRPDP